MTPKTGTTIINALISDAKEKINKHKKQHKVHKSQHDADMEYLYKDYLSSLESTKRKLNGIKLMEEHRKKIK